MIEDERRREDDRVNSIVREYERQRLSGEAGRRGQEEHRASGFAVARFTLLAVDWFRTYLRMSDFGNIRRERVRGRAVVVVESQPKRGVDPNDEVERQMSKTAGTLWIDDESQQVIRAEAYFRDDYNRTIQGSSLWMERAAVNDEVWLPSRGEMNTLLGFAFGKHSLWLLVVEFTDHKKFNVDTDSRFTLPEGHR